jgi:hypothetical protein
VISFVQKRIIKAVHPKRVAMLKKTIHTMATGLTPTRANSEAPPKMIPRPPVIVNPRTTLGIPNLTRGAAITVVALAAGSVRFAPQRLQYFSSTAISLPQEGQYIGTSRI